MEQLDLALDEKRNLVGVEDHGRQEEEVVAVEKADAADTGWVQAPSLLGPVVGKKDAADIDFVVAADREDAVGIDFVAADTEEAFVRTVDFVVPS